MLGIVNRDQFEIEVNDCNDSHEMDYGRDNSISIPVINDAALDKFFDDESGNEVKSAGRTKGALEVPDVLRRIIAGSVIEGDEVSDVSDAFGVSKSSVSSYLNGSHSCASYNKRNETLVNHNREVKNKIVKMTRRRVIKAVRMIDDDKLAGCNAVQLASVAVQLSKVSNDMEPGLEISKSNVAVVVYRPRIREEDTFDVIAVNE